MSKIRNKLIATLTIFAMLFTSLSAVMFAGSNFAKAEGEENAVVGVFQLQDGASSGYIDEEEKNFAGLRWETKINKAYYNSLTTNGETLEFGTLIAPASYASSLDFDSLSYDEVEDEWYVEGTDMYVSNIVNANATSTLVNFGEDVSGEYVMRSAIRYEDFEDEGVNIKDGYATELVARAYVKILDAEGEVIDVKYSDADTVRSLRNSVAYNLAAGNFSEADAASLKNFAVDGDIIDCGEQYAFYNREENTAKITELAGATNVEFILNSKPTSASVDANGVVTFGKMDANDKVIYLSAFANGNLYYKKLTVAKAISTAEEFSETFSLAKGDLTVANNYDDIAVFDGVYVLTNNIDFAGKTMSTEYINVGLHGNDAVHNDSNTNGIIMKTKGLKTDSIFDGQGYTVKNITVGQSGLFGSIAGTVRNVAFVNAKVSSAHSGFLAQRIYLSALIQNVYLDVTASGYALTYAMTAGTNLDTVYVKTNAPLMYAESRYGTTGGVTIDANIFGTNTKLLYVSKSLIVTQGDYRVGYLKNEYTLPYYGNQVMNIPGFEEVTENVFTPRNSKVEITSGDVHRFEDETLLTEKYTNDETAKEFLNSFANDYFAVNNDGRIFWKTDYRLTANDEAITGEGLTLEYGDTVEIDVVDYLGNVSANVVIEDDSDVISIENNIITATNPGTSNVSVYVNDFLLEVFKVTVIKKTIDKTSEEAVLVDANGEAFIAPEGYLEDKISVNAEGVTASIVDGVLTLEGAKVTTDSNGAVTPTEYIVTFETANYIYKYKVKYVTAYIRTAEEFVSTFALAKGDLTSASTLEDLATFDGYYVLANNIDFAGKTMPTEAFTLTGYIPNNMVGLSGTFDGQGYAIYNLVAPEGGVFGAVSGKLMNVAFINCDTTKSGIIAKYSTSQATFTNIYVRYNGGYSSDKYLFVNYPNYNVSLKDCYFEGNLRLYYASTNGANGIALGLSNSNHTAIVITKHILGVRSTAPGYHVEGNSAGSTSSTAYYNDTTTAGTNIQLRCGGELYRYEDVQKLSDMYTNKDSAYTDKTGAVQTLIGKFSSNKYYSVGSTGKIAWVKDTASYAVYADSTLVEGNTINLQTTGTASETVLSVKNLADVIVEGYSYELSNNDGVVALDGAKLTAKKEGTATLTVKKDDVVWFTLTVEVTKPVVQKDLVIEVEQDSAEGSENGVLTAQERASIFGEDSNTVVAVKSLDDELVLELDGENRIIFKDKEGNAFVATGKSYKAIIYNDTYGVELNVMPITKIIRTATDLLTFRLVETENSGININIHSSKGPYNNTLADLNVFDGYYVLNSNIDASSLTTEENRLYSWGYKFAVHEQGNDAIMLTKGLTGTFDGRGYTISNLKLYLGGLFGIVNGTVKNVAFVQPSHYTYGTNLGMYSAVIAQRLSSTAVLENVAIYEPANNFKFIVASDVTVGVKFTNCYFEAPNCHAFTMVGVTSANYGYPRNNTNFLGESSNLVIVSPYLLKGASSGNAYDMKDVTGNNGYFSSSSTVVSGETRSANTTAKRYQNADDLQTRYLLGDLDTVATDKSVSTTETVINAFENDYFNVVVTKDGETITNVAIEWANKNA